MTRCQHLSASLAVLLLGGAWIAIDFSKEIEATATIAELEAAARRQTAVLDELLADEAKYADNLTRDKIAQCAAALVCLGQALQDHPDAKSAKVSAVDLREAGRGIIDGESHADAKSGLAAVREALAGQRSGATERTAWNELVPMDPMMEAFNEVNNKLRRSVRRSDDPEADALDATVGAILSLAMKADTSYVAEEDVPEWTKMSDQLIAEYRGIAKALKTGNGDAAREHHKAVTALCTACHDKFRD